MDEAHIQLIQPFQDNYRSVAEDIAVLREAEIREWIEYRSEIYLSIARALLKVRTERQLLDIVQALELGAML